jgi:hypothetical protein
MDDTGPARSLPCVRLRPVILAVAVACILTFFVTPLVGAAAVLVLAPPAVGIPVALGAGIFAAILGYAMSSSYQWVELDAGILRGRRLLTRKIVELKVTDIVDAQPIHTNFLGPTENAILDALLKTSNRGYQLHFRDGTRLALIRADMSGLDEFLGALAEQLAHNRQDSKHT